MTPDFHERIVHQMATPGTVFTTANSTVGQLPAGATLKVLGNGKVQVVSVPAPTEGQRIRVISKGRIGRVVRMTSRVTDPIKGASKVWYIADGTSVVRVADLSDVQAY